MIGFVVLAALVCTSTCTELTQPSHTKLTQKARVACVVTPTGYELKFYLDVGTDMVDIVYLINDNSDSVSVFDSQTGGISGSGTYIDPYALTVTVSGNVSRLPLTLNKTAMPDAFAYFEGQDVVTIRIMSKSSYRSPFFGLIHFPNDVIYTSSCNFSEVYDLTISTGQLNVTGSLLENAKSVLESLSFQVLLPDLKPAGTIQLGDQILLSIDPVMPTFLEGLYVYNLSVCDISDCSGINIPLLDSYGCSIGNVIEPFSNFSIGVKTPVFTSFRFDNNKPTSELYFRAVVDYCYSADPRCENFCAYNVQKSGRRKREAPGVNTDAGEQAVSTSVRVTVNGVPSIPVDNQAARAAAAAAETLKDDQMNTALLASVIALAALLVVGLMVAICVFVRLTSRRSNGKV